MVEKEKDKQQKEIRFHCHSSLEKMGMTEHGRQIDLELNYEHNLNRPTFNMCKGQFGGGRNGKSLLFVD